MALPERDLVDSALDRAKKRLDGTSFDNWNAKETARLLVDCTEAIVRQIRDADDTIATVLTPAIESQLTDLTIAISGRN